MPLRICFTYIYIYPYIHTSLALSLSLSLSGKSVESCELWLFIYLLIQREIGPGNSHCHLEVYLRHVILQRTLAHGTITLDFLLRPPQYSAQALDLKLPTMHIRMPWSRASSSMSFWTARQVAWNCTSRALAFSRTGKKKSCCVLHHPHKSAQSA